MASQAQTEVLILTPDLEPALYDQAGVLEALRALALDQVARRPVRVLLEDAAAPVKRGHRLIELARRLHSAIELRCPPEELIGSEAPCLIVDARGFGRRRTSAREDLTLDFHDAAEARRLRRRFESIWDQSSPHAELRRLHL